ncbi:MATE family efflux transporter [Tissierella sp. MB52-C2]|uniref:MATE family efflux transporter n=1 Tax=Tissierella sp. MB52-C2 TaxID=3070999 RepID=UPI00280B91F7|nr:MATE family efflux transporter [Tissierella sp. MB52-C2]WMM25976.1 MATE family efflux transporter [Tissierella sp. MB52-C2]
MERQNRAINRITEGVVWKQLLIFFFPLLFGTFFQQLYNTVDAIVVGKYVGKEALSAVGGTTGALINLLVGFFVSVSSGATVAISQYYGADDEENVSRSVHTSIALAISGGIIIMIIGILGAPYALRWMGTPEDIMPYSLQYIRIYFTGMIANLIYNMGSGILRAIGDSKRPLYFLIIGCIMNIILDIIFVVVFGLDVIGVAMATVISQIVSGALVFFSLMSSIECYRLDIKKIRFDNKILRKIVSIGLPTGIQSLMYSASNIIIQSSINSFGTNTVAAWTAYTKIDGIFWMILTSFGIATTTFVGQNFGADKKDRVRKGVVTCILMSAGTSLALSFILYNTGAYLFKFFTDDLKVIEAGVEMLSLITPFYITFVAIEILSGALRGMGDTFIPMIISGIGICALRVLWIFIAVPVWPTIKTVLYSYPITWTVTSILFIFYYMKFLKKKNI